MSCETNGTYLCEHNCTNIHHIKGFVCSCHKGYGLAKHNLTLLLDNQTDIRRHMCVDIDECQSFDSHCPQLCINEKGSYMCGCADNYINSYNTLKNIPKYY